MQTDLNALAGQRMRLVVRLSLLICLMFFPLPLLGQFTDLLDGSVGGGLTWAWLYAFAQFPIAIAVAASYAARARRLDESLHTGDG
jgi:uncharacterized membrane protein (DUF485 family)